MNYGVLYYRLQRIGVSNIQSTELWNLVRETVTALSNNATKLGQKLDFYNAIQGVLHHTVLGGLTR